MILKLELLVRLGRVEASPVLIHRKGQGHFRSHAQKFGIDDALIALERRERLAPE